MQITILIFLYITIVVGNIAANMNYQALQAKLVSIETQLKDNHPCD